MLLKLTAKETNTLLEKGIVIANRNGIPYEVKAGNGKFSISVKHDYTGVKLYDFTKRYAIHCVFTDTLYNQPKVDTDFYTETNEHINPFTDFEEAFEFYEKLVRRNKDYILQGKRNTYDLLELVEISRSVGRHKVIKKERFRQ